MFARYCFIFLFQNMQEGDTSQPCPWLGGGVRLTLSNGSMGGSDVCHCWVKAAKGRFAVTGLLPFHMFKVATSYNERSLDP